MSVGRKCIFIVGVFVYVLFYGCIYFVALQVLVFVANLGEYIILLFLFNLDIRLFSGT